MKTIFDFDEHSNLINEVLHFIDGNNFMQGINNLTTNHNTVITDLNLAKEYAYEKTYIGNSYTWYNLRAQVSSTIWEKIFDLKNTIEIQHKLDNLIKEIDKKVEKYLNSMYYELIDDIIDDLS